MKSYDVAQNRFVPVGTSGPLGDKKAPCYKPIGEKLNSSRPHTNEYMPRCMEIARFKLQTCAPISQILSLYSQQLGL
jgi:hypothetical protein